jgi:hypothetical protein
VLDTLDEATVIPAGQSRTLRVTFTPAASGTVTDAWTLTGTDGSGAHAIPVTGTGVLPGHLTAPASADAGDIVLGDTGSATVTVGNDGELPLTISGVDGPGAPFAVTDAPAPGTTLAAGATRVLHVSFSSLVPGVSTGALTVHSSGGDQTVALSGRGIVVAAPMPDPLPAPDVTGQSRPVLIVSKLRPGLSVTKALLSRDGRKLTVRGRVTAAATGPLSIRVHARAGRKTVTVLSTLGLRGHSTYTITLLLPKAARAWTRLEIRASFAGSDRVWAGTGSLVVVRGR